MQPFLEATMEGLRREKFRTTYLVLSGKGLRVPCNIDTQYCMHYAWPRTNPCSLVAAQLPRPCSDGSRTYILCYADIRPLCNTRSQRRASPPGSRGSPWPETLPAD